MSIFETFFHRQKKRRGDVPDVFTYDTLPENLRVQLVQVTMEILGGPDHYNDIYGVADNVRHAYKVVVQILRKEFGYFLLPHRTNKYDENYLNELVEFMMAEPDVDQVLSAVELVCRLIENRGSKFDYRGQRNAEGNAKEAIIEINQRLRAAGVGYEYDGEIIRIDSELVHVEAVKPALELLRDKRYSGAEQEFRSAYDHYRAGKTKEALTDALKAIESTMKVICNKRGWTFQPTDTAKGLIDVCLKNGLIPTYWQTHFSSLRSMLESSVPTARNKTSGHGQGVTIQQVPDHLASYVLHMTASTIVFLVKAEQALP
jgi:hypothetical protein